MDEIYIFKLFNKNYSKSEPNQNIFLLRVDDNSLKKYGWPIPRGVYAVVLEALNLMGAKAVGFDILFLDSHNKEQDQQFIQAINNSKIPVFLGSELEISLTGHNVLNKAGGIKKPFMKLDKNSLAQYGHLNLILSNTGTPWFIDHHVHIEEEGVSPSLSFLMAQVLNPSLTAKRLPRPIFYQRKSEDFEQMNLSEFMVKLSSQSGAQELAQMIKGRAVLLGFSSKSAGDISVSPFGGEWPGVFVHLNQIENFLSSQSFEVKVGKNIISLLFGFVVLVLCAYSSAVIGTSLFAVLMFFVFSYHQNNLIMDRYYQDAFSFLFFGNLAFFSQMILNFYFKEKSNRFISKAFSSYVDPKLLKHILKAENTIKLGGKKQVVTVLFSDIRNFTTNSEVLEPEEVIELLNEWFTLIEPHISRHKGVIRHYIGDAVMVLYNFPIEDPFQSFNALKSADLILGEAAFFEQKVAEKIGYREGLQPFKVGVAIHTGGVVVGNIGSEKRMEFSAVGDAVNTATRIEGETKHLNNPLAISHEALCQMCFGDYNLKNKTEEEIRTIAKSLKINLGKRVETNVKGRKKVVVFYEFLGFGNI